MDTNTINHVLYYLRVIIFPLCSLGFVISAVYEYQYGKSKLRLAIMLTTAFLLIIWMLITIAAEEFPEALNTMRAFLVTPVIFVLTILIWSYAIKRTMRINGRAAS